MINSPDISLVVPAYNEEIVLPEFMARARAALESTGLSWEMISPTTAVKTRRPR